MAVHSIIVHNKMELNQKLIIIHTTFDHLVQGQLE
jgi:hypothetical protein